MGINFGQNSGRNNNSQSNVVHMGGNNVGALNLNKNDVLDLTKGLEQVVLAAGWDISRNGASFDLDIAAFMLNSYGRVSNLGTDVVYFNNMQAPGVMLEGDNLTGSGDGDDERIQVDLSKIAPYVEKIVFVVTIHEANIKRQTFGMIDNSYVRLLNSAANESEICRFDLKENGSTATSVIFAELYKERNNWKFKAIGEGRVGDLNDILRLYI